jgi:biotin operon repressor
VNRRRLPEKDRARFTVNGTPWTDAEEDRLRALCADPAGYSCTHIAELMGRSWSSIKNRVQRMKNEGEPIKTDPFRRGHAMVRPVAQYEPPSGPGLAEVFAPAESADETEAEFMARMLGQAERHNAKAEAQRHATLRISSDRPVAISLSSDWHVSPKGTDLKGLMAYAEFVAQTPGLYALAVGDLLDNPIKHRGGNIGGVKDELRFLDLLVSKFRGKLLGTTSGNHDDWSKVFAGCDHLKALADRHRIHFAPDELLWNVEITDPTDPDTVTATYRIYTRHQWRRGSALNPGHACWTWWQEEGPNWEHQPDVLAIGHNHVAVVEGRQFAGRDVWALRMGAWQVDSDFARAKGFGRYRATAPTVVLCPRRERPVQAFADPEDAVTFMRGRDAVAA